MRTLCVVVVLGLAGTMALAQDKKPDTPKTDAPVRVRTSLPTGWAKLGLTTEQKDRIYKIRAEHGTEIARLKKQIADLQKKERAALETVLTETQKTRLREIAAEKLPKTSEDKKPATSKPK